MFIIYLAFIQMVCIYLIYKCSHSIYIHTHTHTHTYIHIYNQYPSYLWHCKLDHINETRIPKLHKKRYFDIFFYYESYETCEACLLGKMTKTPFTGNSGHISVDIITLIDDHSRYGYVYLIYIKKV
jgi:hypothetical protein